MNRSDVPVPVSAASVQQPDHRPSLSTRRRRGPLLGVAGLASVAVLGPVTPASATTYYTGRCSVPQNVYDGNNQWTTVYRTFEARIVGGVEANTGKYVWTKYDYRYWVDNRLQYGPRSDEVVNVSRGYDSGLAQIWHSPDNHGSPGDWLPEDGWKGVKSWIGGTQVQFHAAFDIPNTPDPHCDVATAPYL